MKMIQHLREEDLNFLTFTFFFFSLDWVVLVCRCGNEMLNMINLFVIISPTSQACSSPFLSSGYESSLI